MQMRLVIKYVKIFKWKKIEFKRNLKKYIFSYFLYYFSFNFQYFIRGHLNLMQKKSYQFSFQNNRKKNIILTINDSLISSYVSTSKV